jgi:hypothetical protein
MHCYTHTTRQSSRAACRSDSCFTFSSKADLQCPVGAEYELPQPAGLPVVWCFSSRRDSHRLSTIVVKNRTHWNYFSPP